MILYTLDDHIVVGNVVGEPTPDPQSTSMVGPMVLESKEACEDHDVLKGLRILGAEGGLRSRVKQNLSQWLPSR